VKETSLVIVAAGKGERAGGACGTAKQFRTLGGICLWKWSASAGERLYARGRVHECVLVVPEIALDAVHRETFGWKAPFRVVPGGAERQESVLRGIEAASGEYVLVHDGARPFLSEELADRLIDSLTLDCGVIPLLPVSDALKKNWRRPNACAVSERGVMAFADSSGVPQKEARLRAYVARRRRQGRGGGLDLRRASAAPGQGRAKKYQDNLGGGLRPG